MSDSILQGRRTPLASIWTLVLNWVHDLNVAVAVAANVAVPVDDLRPRARDVQITLDAVDGIRFCEKLFNKCMTELDKVPSDSKNGDNRDQALGFYLRRLKEQAGLCSNTANEILQHQVRFASLMAQKIDDASKSQYNVNAGPEATKLTKDINRASRTLSIIVTQMTYDLNSFVSTLEKIQVKVKKEGSLAERILRWLKSPFKSITTIFASRTPPISGTARHHADPNLRERGLINTALGQATSKFCRVDAEPQEGKESESLDSVILFLKQIVPNEAQNAQKKLKQSDEPLRNMERMSASQVALVGGSGTAAVAKEWRDVAKQYQSALE